jgi:uncharacterized protein YqhQ
MAVALQLFVVWVKVRTKQKQQLFKMKSTDHPYIGIPKYERNDPIETNQQQRYSRMDRESEVVSLLSNEVKMVPILTRLVGDKVAIRKNCLCIVP